MGMSAVIANTLDFSGWRLIHMPLNIPIVDTTTQTQVNGWTAGKELRFCPEKAGNGTKNRFDQNRKNFRGGEQMAGGSTAGAVGSTVSDFAISNQTDPNYCLATGQSRTTTI